MRQKKGFANNVQENISGKNSNTGDNPYKMVKYIQDIKSGFTCGESRLYCEDCRYLRQGFKKTFFTSDMG